MRTPVVADWAPFDANRSNRSMAPCTIGDAGPVAPALVAVGDPATPPKAGICGRRRSGTPVLQAPQEAEHQKTRSGALRAALPRRTIASVPRLRIFSGIQPTGGKHVGNYVGAIRQYVSSQDRGEAIFCIVDLHATTVPYEPAVLRERLYDTTAILLAAGLDPDRCILFRQGDVPEHAELCWLLCSVTALGELNRMHQFRDKSAAQRELVSAGLLFYPVLQAADVLAYRTNEVPVGEDQREHLELMRDVARRFNARFGEDLLVVPEHRIPEVGARVRDL